MDNVQKTLLELIKRSQFEPTEVDGCSVDSIDWDCVYDEAVSQSVIGIVAMEIPKEISSINDKFKKARDLQLAKYIRYLYAEDEFTRILNEHHIPFVILKGNAAAIYYKHPENRVMGDIDFLVPQDKFELTQVVLEDNGYIKESEEHTTRHIGYKKNKISFELHHHFSRDDLNIEDYLIAGLEQRVIAGIESHEFPMLPKLSNGLVLLDHMRAHLQSGLGLRQVIDWMLYVNRELSDDFWREEFAYVVKEKGLDKFAIVTTRMCQLYMGLPDTINWCKEADEKLCERLLNMLYVSGNFGHKSGSGNSIETIRTKMKKQGTFKWLQTAGEHNWNLYKKHHWLRPFCWLYQTFRYAKQGFKTGRSYRQLTDDFSRSKNRSDLLKELGI